MRLPVPLTLIPLVLGSPLLATPTLTFQGMIGNGPDHVDQPFSLTITLTGNPAALETGPIEVMTVYDIAFGDQDLTHVDLIAGVTGTDITGLWSRPDSGPQAPETSIALGDSALRIYIGSDTMEDLGLSFHGRPVGQILLAPGLLGATWSPTPGDFSRTFLGLAGTYALFNLEPSYIWALDGSDAYILSLESLTVVPEPSTYGLILGALALAGAAVRRRKTSK